MNSVISSIEAFILIVWSEVLLNWREKAAELETACGWNIFLVD